MRIRCRLSREAGGGWKARHESEEVGSVEVLGASREQAIEKIKGEIRYRLELCPCTGETYQHIEIEVDES
jgi:hypothetical protein